MINIKRLEQICIEDAYCRSDIRAKVLRDMENGLQEPMERAVTKLNEYFHRTYYASKNRRLDAYSEACGLCLEDLVAEVCLIVLPNSKPTSIQSVVGKLATVLNYPDIWDGIRTAAEIVTVVCFSDLYDLIPAKHSETGSIMVQSNYSLEEKTMLELAHMKYLPPLVCRPNEIEYNNQSGYLGKDESVILGKGNHHDKPLALDALNIASSVAMSLDKWVLSQPEDSKKPLDTLEKKENFERMEVSSRRVYEELLEKGNKFYFEWKFDKRGRMYSSGYHVNIQSTEYKKALINLAEPQLIKWEQ